MNQINNDDEIDLRDYLEVVWRRRSLIAKITVGFVGLVFILGIMQKPVYESTVKIMMRSGGKSSLSQYSGLAGMLGVNLAGGSNADDLMELIKSRVVAAKVLDDLNLTKRINDWDNPKRRRSDLISMVSGMVKQPKATGNIYDIKAEAGDPQLAADVANGFVEALSYYWNELNFSEAQKKLKYIETELPRVEKDLRLVEGKLKLIPRANTGLSLGGQGGAQRDFDIYNSVYTMLRKELESTKLEAAKEIPPFSVVDKAEKPLGRSRPKLKLNLMIGFVVGLFSGVFVVFFQEYWEKSGKRA